MTGFTVGPCEKAEPESAGSGSAPSAGGALSPAEEIGGLWRGVKSLKLKQLGGKGEGGEPITEGLLVEVEEATPEGGGEEIKSWAQRVEEESEKGSGRGKSGESWILDESVEDESLGPAESLPGKLSQGEWDRVVNPWHKPYWGVEDPQKEPLKFRREGS